MIIYPPTYLSIHPHPYPYQSSNLPIYQSTIPLHCTAIHTHQLPSLPLTHPPILASLPPLPPSPLHLTHPLLQTPIQSFLHPAKEKKDRRSQLSPKPSKLAFPFSFPFSFPSLKVHRKHRNLRDFALGHLFSLFLHHTSFFALSSIFLLFIFFSLRLTSSFSILFFSSGGGKNREMRDVCVKTCENHNKGK